MKLTNKHRLYKFCWDYRRSGEVSSLFFATEDQIEKAIGSDIYFGEILGKHSEVCGTLKKNDLTKLNVDTVALQELHNELGDTISGYNPLNYIHCSKCHCHEDDCWCNHCTECTEEKSKCKCLKTE